MPPEEALVDEHDERQRRPIRARDFSILGMTSR
jgi:hypothetical protein